VRRGHVAGVGTYHRPAVNREPLAYIVRPAILAAPVCVNFPLRPPAIDDVTAIKNDIGLSAKIFAKIEVELRFLPLHDDERPRLYLSTVSTMQFSHYMDL